MAPKTKRPISVWIAQIILGIYACGITLIVLWGLYKGLSEGIPNPELYLVTTVGVLTFATLFFGGVWGMAIRKSWGRWLGVAGLTILLISGVVTQTSRLVAETKSGESLGFIRILLAVLVVGGLAYLAFIIATGDTVDKFFSGESAKAPNVSEADHADNANSDSTG
jgi:hypothetical protein